MNQRQAIQDATVTVGLCDLALICTGFSMAVLDLLASGESLPPHVVTAMNNLADHMQLARELAMMDVTDDG